MHACISMCLLPTKETVHIVVFSGRTDEKTHHIETLAKNNISHSVLLTKEFPLNKNHLHFFSRWFVWPQKKTNTVRLLLQCDQKPLNSIFWWNILRHSKLFFSQSFGSILTWHNRAIAFAVNGTKLLDANWTVRTE